MPSGSVIGRYWYGVLAAMAMIDEMAHGLEEVDAL